MTALLAAVMVTMTCTACGQQKNETAEQKIEAAEKKSETTEKASETAEKESTGSEEVKADETEAAETDAASAEGVLEDGEYLAEFDTDSGMFHANEACDGKGTLTVKDGVMTIHVSMASKNIVNLFPGLAEDAQKEGAEILEPTLDNVTYSDGFKEEVYGFDIPVPALDEEFDLALIGKKGTWYDHKVSVSNPVKAE